MSEKNLQETTKQGKLSILKALREVIKNFTSSNDLEEEKSSEEIISNFEGISAKDRTELINTLRDLNSKSENMFDNVSKESERKIKVYDNNEKKQKSKTINKEKQNEKERWTLGTFLFGNFWVYRIICVKFKNKPSYDKIKMS